MTKGENKMKERFSEEVEALMDEFPEAERFRKARVKWEGYTVYYPVYSGCPKIGLPTYILEKDGVARLSEGHEGIRCMNFIDDLGKKK